MDIFLSLHVSHFILPLIAFSGPARTMNVPSSLQQRGAEVNICMDLWNTGLSVCREKKELRVRTEDLIAFNDRLLMMHLWENQTVPRSSNLTKLTHFGHFLKVPNLKIVLFNSASLRRCRETFLSESWTLSSEWLWSFAGLLIKAKLNFVDQK